MPKLAFVQNDVPGNQVDHLFAGVHLDNDFPTKEDEFKY